MKINTFLLALAILPVASHAQNLLTVADTTIPQSGGEMTFNFTFAEENVYSTYQFKIETPEGMEYVTDSEGDVECILGDCHTASHTSIVHWNTDSRVLGVGVTSMSSSLLKGTSGMLISIPVAATVALVGTEFTIAVKGITYIRQNGTKDLLDDVTFTITIGEPDDGRLKFYETAATLPEYTAGDKADITMYRTIRGGEWSTLVLPFTLTAANAKKAFGDDVQFAKFTGFEVDYGEDEENVTPLGITINLVSYSIPARGGMAGGTPVLVKTGQDIEGFQLDGVTLTSGVTEATAKDVYETPGKLTGTLVKTVIPEDGLFISDNKFWYSTGKTSVKAFRCWFELGAVLDKETAWSRVKLSFNDSGATGISQIENRKSENSQCFDLQGRRVKKPARGIYVSGGKKKVVR